MAMIPKAMPPVTPPPVKVFIGAGSNIGDGRANLLRAMEKLRRLPGFELTEHSSFYRTEPIGQIPQAWFVNAVFAGFSGLSPRDLLFALKDIEKALGRKEAPRWSPRVIDLDLLLYGDLVTSQEGLKIPHPEMHRRGFVLTPLAEIAPQVMHPVYRLTVVDLLRKLDDKGVVILDSPRQAADSRNRQGKEARP